MKNSNKSMTTFLLEGSVTGDIVSLDGSQSSKMTIDDEQIGGLNLWTSDKIRKELALYTPTIASGTCSVPACQTNNSWQRMTFAGSSSFISTDKQGLIMPLFGCYIFTLTISEKAKLNPSEYSIELKTVALPDTTSVLFVPITNNPSLLQCHRIMLLNATDQVDVRVWQQQSCGTLTSFAWALQYLQ